MVLNLLLILSLHLNQRKRRLHSRVNVLLAPHALPVLNLYGDHVLGNTLEKTKWFVLLLLLSCVWIFWRARLFQMISSKFNLNYFLMIFLRTPPPPPPPIRWSALINHCSTVKICVEILSHAVIIIARKPVMHWRDILPWTSCWKVSLVKFVVFHAKRCWTIHFVTFSSLHCNFIFFILGLYVLSNYHQRC